MSCSRRKFLTSLLRGAGGVIVASLTPLNVSAIADQPNTDAPNQDELLALFRQGKELFYRKQYGSAAITYQRLIALQPKSIEAYDGLGKVYAAQNQLVQVADLFKNALAKNNQSVAFYDRYARALMSLSTGNYTQQQQFIELYGENSNLFEKAGQLYVAAIGMAPEKRYLQLGLLDVANRLKVKNKLLAEYGETPLSFSESNLDAIARAQSTAGIHWQQTRKPVAHIAENPEAQLQKIGSKKRRELYSEQERTQRAEHITKAKTHMYYPLLAQAFKERKMENAENHALLILEMDSNSSVALNKLRRIYASKQQYDKLQAFYEKRSETKDDAWTQLALANSTLRHAQLSGNAADLEKTQGIIQQLLEQEELESTKSQAAAEWIKATALTSQKKYALSRRGVAKALEELKPDSGLSTSLRLAYVDSYLKENKPVPAALLLRAMTSGNLEGLQNEPLLANLNRWKQKGLQNAQVVKRNLDTYYKLAMLQKKQGQRTELKKTLEQIKALDPNSRFAKKVERN